MNSPEEIKYRLKKYWYQIPGTIAAILLAYYLDLGGAFWAGITVMPAILLRFYITRKD